MFLRWIVNWFLLNAKNRFRNATSYKITLCIPDWIPEKFPIFPENNENLKYCARKISDLTWHICCWWLTEQWNWSIIFGTSALQNRVTTKMIKYCSWISGQRLFTYYEGTFVVDMFITHKYIYTVELFASIHQLQLIRMVLRFENFFLVKVKW